MSTPFFISGDWPFFFSEQIKSWSWVPSAYWTWSNFGENAISRLWIDYPFRLIVKLFGFPWVITEKLLLLCIIFLAFWSMYRLSTRYVNEHWLRRVSSVIYVCNTYFFLVLGGGQLGVAASYAVFPYVLLRWLIFIDKPSFRGAILTGVYFAMLAALDLRIAYLFTISLCIYFLMNVPNAIKNIKYFIISVIATMSLHLYWLLPGLMWVVTMPESAGGGGSLLFFSVADFSHALTLLHPNWPENLFGRVYFQQPEFILLPILAFSSLLFIKKKEVLFFPLVALVGVFLAKGVNPPGGGVYEFLFTYIPGFVMFRDPTKFYVFIALGYSILIPFTLSRFIRLKKLLIGMFIITEILLLRDVFLGKTTHSFQFQPIPKEYELLKNILRADTQFSRVLWIPQASHFAYSDDTHPHVDAVSISKPFTREILSEKSIGYIVVPTDIGKNIFLTDYQYDPSQRQTIVNSLDESIYPRLSEFTQLAVFRNLNPADLFESEGGNKVLWRKISTNTYSIEIPSSVKMLVMHLAFDPGWRLDVNGKTVSPTQTTPGWMQFELPGDTGEATVYFAPDAIAKTGAVISGLLLILYVMVWMF